MQDPNDVVNPYIKVRKSFAERAAAKFQEHSGQRGHDVSMSKMRVGKPLATQFQGHADIGQQEAYADVSKLKVPENKLLAPTNSVFHYEEHNEIGQQEALGDVSKIMFPKGKRLAPTTSVPEFRKNNNIGKQERGGRRKLKSPKVKTLPGTSVSQFQEYHAIGQSDAHDDVSNSRMQTSKILGQTAYIPHLQENSEIGPQEALDLPKISKERQKSGNSTKRSDNSGVSLSGLPKHPQLTTLEKKYRALRQKYLRLEEESSMLENELKKTDSAVKSLENEKHTLLDKLVVLEGLVDPSVFKDLSGCVGRSG